MAVEQLLIDSIFFLWEIIFLIFFLLELLLRMLADRGMFLHGPEYRWNIFDAIIVGMSILEHSLEALFNASNINLPFLRLIRLFRVVRIAKVLHIIPFFRNLGAMLKSCLNAVGALLPACGVLMLMMYLFGMCIMQGVNEHLIQQSRPFPEMDVLFERYGDTRRTLLSLFMSVTNGISWEKCIDPLAQVGVVYQLVFIIYIVSVQLGVLNIVMGIFVDSVHQMCRPDREEVIAGEEKQKQLLIEQLMNFFLEADSDRNGTLSWPEFEAHVGNYEIKSYLEALGLNVLEAQECFHLMDSDSSGEVDIKEFIGGFMYLRGYARNLDMWLLRNQVEHMQDILGRIYYSVRSAPATRVPSKGLDHGCKADSSAGSSTDCVGSSILVSPSGSPEEDLMNHDAAQHAVVKQEPSCWSEANWTEPAD